MLCESEAIKSVLDGSTSCLHCQQGRSTECDKLHGVSKVTAKLLLCSCWARKTQSGVHTEGGVYIHFPRETPRLNIAFFMLAGEERRSGETDNRSDNS